MEFLHGPLPLQHRRSRLALPLAGERVAAGFPSPADDYMEVGIDLNEQLIQHPTSTSVSYTHLRAHETGRTQRCRLKDEKKERE